METGSDKGQQALNFTVVHEFAKRITIVCPSEVVEMGETGAFKRWQKSEVIKTHKHF